MKKSSYQLWKEGSTTLQTIYEPAESQALLFWLLEALFQLTKTQVLAQQEIPWSPDREQAWQQALIQLQEQEPIQYITGHAEFYGRNFKVSPSVLIPRPETEELVDKIIQKHQASSDLRILDIGTGSGCIAVTLAAELNGSEVTGMDISEAALRLAQENATVLKTPVKWIQADALLANWPFSDHYFDVIVSNPPYVRQSEKKQMQANVLNYEPALALFVADEAPLVFYEKIIQAAQTYLKPQGEIYFEINENFGEAVLSLLQAHHFQDGALWADLSGKDRFVYGVKISN